MEGAFARPAFKAFVFDLDGTLLHTLPDLVALTNATLEASGYPPRTDAEILSFVGNGARSLMLQAVPAGTPETAADAALVRWKSLYPTYGHKLTRPFPHIEETLSQLRERGARLGVLSNKFDAGAQDVIAAYLPNTFDAVHGESADYPRKPNPTGLLRMLAELGVSPDEAIYIGDSAGDVDVAVAAGVFPIGVTWGYQPVDCLRERGAKAIIEDPRELLAWSITAEKGAR